MNDVSTHPPDPSCSNHDLGSDQVAVGPLDGNEVLNQIQPEVGGLVPAPPPPASSEEGVPRNDVVATRSESETAPRAVVMKVGRLLFVNFSLRPLDSAPHVKLVSLTLIMHVTRRD